MTKLLTQQDASTYDSIGLLYEWIAREQLGMLLHATEDVSDLWSLVFGHFFFFVPAFSEYPLTTFVAVDAWAKREREIHTFSIKPIQKICREQ